MFNVETEDGQDSGDEGIKDGGEKMTTKNERLLVSDAKREREWTRDP